VHAEVLGDEPIGRAAPRDHPHEREVGDVLHRREHECRSGIWEKVAHRSAPRNSIDIEGFKRCFGKVQNRPEKDVDSDLLHTEKILADRKVFFLDLKRNARGMVVKITEDVGGNRDTIMVPAEILGDFIAALVDIKATADDQD
jgi:hypothetical protein